MKSAATLEHSHHPDAIRERLRDKRKFNYLGDAVLGAIDGCVTTFAIVAGVMGGALKPAVALLLGLANLAADGLSMAVSNYQRAKSDRELIDKVRKMEERHIEKIPEGEREEISQIYRNKGFEEPLLGQVVGTITRDKNLWVNTMLAEEFGLPLVAPDPYKAGLVTFLAFLVVGSIPLLPFLFSSSQRAFSASFLMTGLAFFLIGFLKGKIVRHSGFFSGLETLVVGGLAAGLAYLIGLSLRGLV